MNDIEEAQEEQSPDAPKSPLKIKEKALIQEAQDQLKAKVMNHRRLMTPAIQKFHNHYFYKA